VCEQYSAYTQLKEAVLIPMRGRDEPMAEKRGRFLDFKCPECGGQLRAKREHAGRKGKCPKCGKIVAIPKETIS
jgi:ribosomal protein S27E